MNVTDELINYLDQKSKTVTESIMTKAADCRRDYFSVVAAGASKTKKQWERYLKFIPDGSSKLHGYSILTDCRSAAFINGFNAHVLELDDGHRFAMIHLGAVIISAIDAIESLVNDESYLMGIIMGYEAACRIAIAMQPSHKRRGYHTTGTCGTIGAAVGVAYALGMNNEQMKRVITSAAGSAAGMLEMQEQGSEMKAYNTARAAMDGLSAALFGFAGFNTPDDILGGERGFLVMHSDNYDLNKLVEYKEYFEIERIYVKPYASCRHSHSAVEAAIKLHDLVKNSIIDHVLVKTYKLGVKGHDHTAIMGTASAKLSTPYAVAAGLLYGRADLTVFEPVDNKIAETAALIKIEEDPQLSELAPAKRVAVVTVYTTDGNQYTERVDYAKGDPENPLTVEEFTKKSEELKEYCEKAIGGNDEQHG